MRSPSRRPTWICGAVGVAAIAMTACSSGGSKATATTSTSPTSSAPTTSSSVATATTGKSTSSTGAPNPGVGTAPTTAPTHPGATGPVIVSFTVTHKPACPVVATADAPFSKAGEPITLAWNVTGATGIALSIDDPTFYAHNGTGNYANYGPEGTVTLPFTCDPTVQPNTSHAYTIDTRDSSGVSKTITESVPTSP